MTRSFTNYSDYDGITYADQSKAIDQRSTRKNNSLTDVDTGNATYFWTRDLGQQSDTGGVNYKRLDGYNSGRSNLQWLNHKYFTYLTNKGLISALSCQLDLSAAQRSKAYNWFMSLNLRKWGVRAELTAFCVCAVTVHRDELCTNRSYHPNQNKEKKDEKFKQIAEEIGLRERDIQREYAKHEQKFCKDAYRGTNEYNKYEQWDRRGI